MDKAESQEPPEKVASLSVDISKVGMAILTSFMNSMIVAIATYGRAAEIRRPVARRFQAIGIPKP